MVGGIIQTYKAYKLKTPSRCFIEGWSIDKTNIGESIRFYTNKKLKQAKVLCL